MKLKSAKLVNAMVLTGLLAVGTSHASITNQDTGQGYHPTFDAEGNMDDPPEWVAETLNEPTIDVTRSTGGSSNVTIRGRVFFNDRRNDGLFSTRLDKNGNPGTRCNTAGVRDDSTACSINWLAARYMVVDVIEVDEGYFAPTAWDCKKEDIVASVAIGQDGSFTATFPASDACDSDARAQTAIALRVRLRYCGDWCFSVNSDDNEPYALNYPGATPGAPLLVSGGQDITLGDMNFNPAGTPAGTATDITRAANYYASLVDTVLTLHRDNGIPFYKDEFGEIQYIYPSTESSTATTKSASRVVISNFEGSGWIKGDTSAHEYGHVTMLRAWDGDYGFDGVGISANDTSKAPSRQIAFKEAWAEFIVHAVMTETDGCARAKFDDNAKSTTNIGPLGALGEGASWRLNVTKSLCDWYDNRDEDDTTLAGAGDHFDASSLYSVWYNLRKMYTKASEYSGEGLWFCDYVDYYLDVRQSSAAVGVSKHNEYVDKVTDLIYNNNIACFMPAPN